MAKKRPKLTREYQFLEALLRKTEEGIVVWKAVEEEGSSCFFARIETEDGTIDLFLFMGSRLLQVRTWNALALNISTDEGPLEKLMLSVDRLEEIRLKAREKRQRAAIAECLKDVTSALRKAESSQDICAESEDDDEEQSDE